MNSLFKAIFFYLVVFALSTNAHAKIVFLQNSKIKVSTDVKAWATKVKVNTQKSLKTLERDAKEYTECQETEELEGAILCGSYIQRAMNRIFIRPAIYSEGGMGPHPSRTLVKKENPHLKAWEDMVGGHDIFSKELLEFYDKMAEKCTTDTSYCLTKTEKNFYDTVIVPLRARGKPFVIITFSVQSTLTPHQVVSHEFLHAHFFLDPKYQQRVTEFWEKHLNESERSAIRKTLQEVGYDSTDEVVMKNEFQAYILMYGANDSKLEKFVPLYREKIENFMAEANLSAVQVKP